MIAYHGTNTSSANTIVGPPPAIDVKLGGGELGRGFYLGESIALASSLAKGRFGISDGVVIRFEIDDSDYFKLNTRILNWARFVYQSWQQLILKGKTNKHLFNVDVVCAPFATINFSYQYKFESQKAEDLLNIKANKKIL